MDLWCGRRRYKGATGDDCEGIRSPLVNLVRHNLALGSVIDPSRAMASTREERVALVVDDLEL